MEPCIPAKLWILAAGQSEMYVFGPSQPLPHHSSFPEFPFKSGLPMASQQETGDFEVGKWRPLCVFQPCPGVRMAMFSGCMPCFRKAAKSASLGQPSTLFVRLGCELALSPFSGTALV